MHTDEVHAIYRDDINTAVRCENHTASSTWQRNVVPLYSNYIAHTCMRRTSMAA